ncbi:MAG: dihydroorotate dehydrogenase electron transfer subunit [Treponema sp.]|nr:dihydroorotate dehydrogenase electron transfer subunit [Treponema sp.]
MKQCFSCELIYNIPITKEIFRLDFEWSGSMPKAGQFFMIKPKRSSVFLPRPVSVALWEIAATNEEFIRNKVRSKKNPYQRHLMAKYLNSNTVRFLIAKRGKGTGELSALHTDEEAELTGPLGNAWTDFLPALSGSKARGLKPIALIGGGIGIAPLLALSCELPENSFDFYAGFKTGFRNQEEKTMLLGQTLLGSQQIVISAENGKSEKKGVITDFLNPSDYSAVCACGPTAMLRVVADKCAAAGVPCYVSMERHMACGVGACLGCTVATTKGNRRCCTDGPVFPASEVFS